MSEPTDADVNGPDDLPPVSELAAELREPPDPEIVESIAGAIHRRAAAHHLADLSLVGLLRVLLEYVRLFFRLSDEDEPSSREPTNGV